MSKPIISISIPATESSLSYSEFAFLSERLGYDRFMINDSRGGRDVYSSLALCAHATKKVQVGCAVTTPTHRQPAVTAAAIATINEVSNGRAVLGIGAGRRDYLKESPLKTPLGSLREAVNTMRTIWSGTPFVFQGRAFEFFTQGIKIPILITSISPLIQGLAGEVADIAMIGPTVISGYNFSRHLMNIKKGIQKRSRELEPPSILPHVLFCCSKDGKLAKRSAKVHVADAVVKNVKSGKVKLSDINVGENEFGAIKKSIESMPSASSQHDLPRELDKSVSDELVDSFAIAGTQEECIGKIKNILSFGFDGIELYVLSVLGHANTYLGYQEALISSSELVNAF